MNARFALLTLPLVAAACSGHGSNEDRVQALLHRRLTQASTAVQREANVDGAMCEANRLQAFCSVQLPNGRCRQYVVAFYAGRAAVQPAIPPVGDPCATPTFDKLGW